MQQTRYLYIPYMYILHMLCFFFLITINLFLLLLPVALLFFVVC